MKKKKAKTIQTKKESKKTDNSRKEISAKDDEYIPANSEEQLALKEIFTTLLKSSQIDFSQYRHSTVMRRLNRRMNLCKQNNYSEYLKFLEKNPTETEKLFYDLLLYYTQFFRDPYIFDTLKKKVFPALIKNHSTRKPIRIWIPGCSTGEEVYSMAICLYEFLDKSKLKIPVQLFGTDLVEQHIITARAGLYSEKIKKEISKERLDRFFDQASDGLKLIKHIREMCVFAVQDITKDPPFPNIDLISCRNVLIYFDSAFQDAAIPRFHFALKPDGFLLLGSSETMGKYPKFFNTVDQKANLYLKRTTDAKPEYRFPVSQKSLKLKSMTGNIPAIGNVSGTEITKHITSILMEAYAPPGLLIDSNMQIRQFIGNTFPYLGPVSGKASLKLSKMAGEGLMPDLYLAIEEVKMKQHKIRKNNISFRRKGLVKTINICVIPITDPATDETNFLILFEESDTTQVSFISSIVQDGQEDNDLQNLKHELQSNKEHLQTIIEEKDNVNQDLWAANEEILSTNEELQSVNEELEAAKEEMESGNEELIALNEELHTKNIELKSACSATFCFVISVRITSVLSNTPLSF